MAAGTALRRVCFVRMLTIPDAQQRTEEFLTGQMLDALRTVEYELPSFDTEPPDVAVAEAARGRVEIRHVRGASDATYIVQAFGEELLMQLQLNVYRLVVVYRVPALGALDAGTLAVHLDRWRIGAEHAGWKFGWRDAPIANDAGRRYVETYCYAFASVDFLENALEQLYWRTDIVQMTRYYMLEAARCGVRLSPRQAGFPV
jgi:hypothetical protein